MLSKSHRKRVRRLERAYFDTGRARCHVVQSPAELEHGYRVLTDLHAKRWAALGTGGIFNQTATHAFHREAMQALLTRGELRLSINGKEVTVGKDCVPRRGYLSLEAEGSEAHFKNLRIKELTKKP